MIYTRSHPDIDGDCAHVMTLVNVIPKCWHANEHEAHVNAICCAHYEALDTANFSSNEISIVDFTEPATCKVVLVQGHKWHIIL